MTIRNQHASSRDPPARPARRIAYASSTPPCATASRRPGFSMDRRAKLRMAQALEALGVDVLEAGFPQASPDDFAAVAEIARTLKTTTVCGLARCQPRRHRHHRSRAGKGAALAHPRVPVDQPAASRAQAAHEQGAGGGCRHRRGRARAPALPRSRVLRRGCPAHRARLPGRGVQRRGRRRRHHAQRAGHRRLHHAVGNGRAVHLPAPARAGRGQGDLLQPLPRRPGHGGGQLDGRDQRRRAAGGMHHQRHRRARRQCRAGRDRDGAEGARRRTSAWTPASTRAGCIPPRAC